MDLKNFINDLNDLSASSNFFHDYTKYLKEALGRKYVAVYFLFDNSYYIVKYGEDFSRTKLKKKPAVFELVGKEKLYIDKEGHSGSIAIRNKEQTYAVLTFSLGEPYTIDELKDYLKFSIIAFERHHFYINNVLDNFSSASRELLDSMSYPAFILNKNKELILSNFSFYNMIDLSKEEKSFNGLKKLIINKSIIDVMFREAELKDKWKGIIWLKKADGSVFPQEISLIIKRDNDNEILFYFFILNHLSVQSKVEEDLDYFANYDFLTNLPNRKGFNDKVNYLMENNIEFALVLFDLDKFKFINDHYGHSFGDELLSQFSKLLKENFNRSLFKCRLSGDEFVLLYEYNVDSDLIKKDLENFFRVFEKPMVINNIEYLLSISAGITLYPKFGNSFSSIVSSAEYAIKVAKHSEESSYIFYNDTLKRKHLERLAIIQKLKDAIANDEFFMYYQPIFNNKKEICKVEALIRWKDEKGNFIPPFVFIPISEETGLIREISRKVGKMVVRDLHRLLNQGFNDIQISVNISLKDFEERYFKKKSIFDYLTSDSKISKNIILEITESLFMKESINYLEQLEDLKKKGFHIALDDFGTGYSSLSYLTKLPIDTIKIDRSFILSLTDKRSSELVKIIIHMAKVLNLDVVAEGVEEEIHFNFLNELDCEYYQGYYFEKPMDIESLINLLKK